MLDISIGEYLYNVCGLEKGYYVDVGTFNGISDITISETLFLEKQGWEGVCIEGNNLIYEKLKQNRKAVLYNVFVGRKSGEIRKVVQTSPQYGGSGIQENLPQKQQEFLRELDSNLQLVEVETRHLEDILDEIKAPKSIQLLKLDTEGTCFEIIQSLSFDKYLFDYISLENFCNNIEEGSKLMLEKSYLPVVTLNENTLFRYNNV